MAIRFLQIFQQTPKKQNMKTLKIIGLIMFFGGILTQVVDYFFLETSAENFFIGPFFWGAIITCVGALLWTIYCSKAIRERNTISENRMKNIIIADTNVDIKELIDEHYERYDVFFGNTLIKDEDVCNRSLKQETMSEEDKISQKIHCQLTTPGLWPCE